MHFWFSSTIQLQNLKGFDLYHTVFINDFHKMHQHNLILSHKNHLYLVRCGHSHYVGLYVYIC